MQAAFRGDFCAMLCARIDQNDDLSAANDLLGDKMRLCDLA
jgi:hypothetical protein